MLISGRSYILNNHQMECPFAGHLVYEIEQPEQSNRSICPQDILILCPKNCKLLKSSAVLRPKFYDNQTQILPVSVCVLCIQIHPKLIHDILGLLIKPKTPGHCEFPLTNLHSGESVCYVPE